MGYQASYPLHFVEEQERAGRQLAVYDPAKGEFQPVHLIG